MSILTLNDLNTTINHEPRILDTKLAKSLGFKQPRMIRKLINRYLPELERLGTCSTVERVIRGNVAKEFYLTRKQSIFICMKSETAKAIDVALSIVEVFESYLRGELVPATITPAQQCAIREAIGARVEKDGTHYAYYYGRFNNHFKIAKYTQLPTTQFEAGLEYIGLMPSKTPALPTVSAPTIEDEDIKLTAKNLIDGILQCSRNIRRTNHIRWDKKEGQEMVKEYLDQTREALYSCYQLAINTFEPDYADMCRREKALMKSIENNK